MARARGRTVRRDGACNEQVLASKTATPRARSAFSVKKELVMTLGNLDRSVLPDTKQGRLEQVPSRVGHLGHDLSVFSTRRCFSLLPIFSDKMKTLVWNWLCCRSITAIVPSGTFRRCLRRATRHVTILRLALNTASPTFNANMTSRIRPILLKTLKYSAAGTVVGTAVGLAAFRYEFGEDALPRLFRSYRDAIPAFGAYKKVQLLKETIPKWLGKEPDPEEIAAAYEALHEHWAPRMLDAAFELGGFYLKGGQLVASNYGNAFPRAWVKALEPVLDAIPHKPFEQVKKLVESEFGEPLEAVYSSFEEVPIAAASIGQVHRATLKQDGRKVVVKVQYPEVEKRFYGDVHVSKAFFRYTMPEQAILLDEVEKQFVNEFDYRREATQLEGVRKNLAAAQTFKDVVVPEPVMSLCTKYVLTMTEIPNAIKLTTALEQDMEEIARTRGITVKQLLHEEDRLNQEALAGGQLRNGPDAKTMESFINYRRWSNFFRRLAFQPTEHIPLNHAQLIDELFRIHGHEIFVDGYFNGDPHPGNLLVVRKPDGDFQKLALVDYGQVKSLTPEHRLNLSRIIVGLAKADPANPLHRKKIAELSMDMGLRTARNDPDVIFKLVSLTFDRADPLVTDGKNIMQYMEELGSADPTQAVGDDYVLATRCQFMLRGLGSMLNQHRSGAKMWLPFAEKVMRDNGEDPDKLFD